jgi:hypothetical protein
MSEYEKRKSDFLKRLEEKGTFDLVGQFKNLKTENTTFKCKMCSFTFESTGYKILKRKFCPNCRNNESYVRDKRFKPLYMTHPKLSEYLLNKDDSCNYPARTSKMLKWVCPVCGIIFKKSPRRIEGEYVCCKGCSDNYSQPNKYFYSFLRELGVEFEIEKVFSWSKFDNRKNFKYDFYIESKNMIVEVMGIQHYPFDGLYYKTSYEKQHEVDIEKERLAMANSISFYVKIDARESGFDFLKNSIIQSMNEHFNLNHLSWENINCLAIKGFMKQICDMYNSGQHMIKEISKKMKLSRNTVSRYLKRGSAAGICSYNITNTLKTKKIVKTRFYDKRLDDNFIDVCNCYNSLSVKLVSYVKEKMQSLPRKFIIRCLEKGNECGLCDYNKNTINTEKIKACKLRCNGGDVILQKNEFGNIINEYKNLRHAADCVGLNYNELSRFIIQKISYNGFIFEYKSGKTIPRITKTSKETSIQVDQFTKNGLFLMTYDSMNEAFRKTGIPRSAISRACSGKYKHAGGFVWKKHTE